MLNKATKLMDQRNNMIKEAYQVLNVLGVDVTQQVINQIIINKGKIVKVEVTNEDEIIKLENEITFKDGQIFGLNNRIKQLEEEIEFVNGESTDGSIVLDIEFNGIVKETDGRLIYEVDAYAFELTTGLLVNQTYAKDATPKAPKFDNGAFFESTTKNMDTAIIRGKNNNIITSRQNLLGRFIASQPVQGTVAIDQIISFVKPGSKQQQLFLIVLA